jgi:hypothetical protein
MVVSCKASISGYNKNVWFIARAITNIIALRNLIDQYRITYDSDDLMFAVHHVEEQIKYGISNARYRLALL